MMNKFSISVLALVTGCLFLFAESNSVEYRKASQYIDQMGEAFLKVYVDSKFDIEKLNSIVSIDEIKGYEIYVFANRVEFEDFLTLNLDYETLIPPSLLGPAPEMSDYSNPNDRQYDKYPTYDGYVNLMNDFQKDYPDKVMLDTIGKSVQGRLLLVAKVSDNVREEECEPEWFMVGAPHGNETMGIMLSIRMIDYLCTNYKRDPRATRILDSIEMYFCPISNPDGTYKGGNHTVQGATRYNANGKDMNRNYPKVPGAGTSEYPEPETKAFLTWIESHNIMMNIDWHAGVETAIYPYSGISRRTPDDKWWKYVCRIYADLTQSNGPSGYYNDCDNGICNGYADLGYVARGTTKDYYYFYAHGRGISNEVTSTKLLPESDINDYWEYNIDALLAYIPEALNGIRGTVVDEVTKVGLPAKVFVENHDKVGDSSWVYADSSGGHGNYYRPIYEGTYTVTYSCPGCESKTLDGIKVTNGKATIVDVELDCGSTFLSDNYEKETTPFTVSFGRKGITINYENLHEIKGVGLYNVNGKLLNVLPVQKSIHWKHLGNGTKVNSGCYIIRIETGKDIFTQSFIVSH